MILAIYNSFTIPIQFAFHLHSMDHPVYVLVDTFINVIFILDMLVNFRTTYIDEETGEEITEPKEIASNYIKSKFKIDLIGVIPYDDIARFWISCGSSHSVNWIILIKMIRVLKVYDVISSTKVREETKVLIQLIKILYLFILYLHCHAWAWYYIVEQDEHWYPPVELWYGEHEFYEHDLIFKYFNCLLHALFMFGGGDIGPHGTFQIAWTWFFIFIGALLEALLFGKFADLALEMNKKGNEQEEKLDMVNSTIKSLSIPEKLQLKIEGYLAYTQETLESQSELKAFLEVISPSLKEEVIQHIFKEPLSENPIFNFDDQLIVKFTKRLEIQVNSPEDVVINQGDKGEHLYIISKGEFIVSVQGHDSSSEVTNVIKSGDIFGEVALLLNCKRTATVKANNYATIAKIDKRSFI